MRTIYKYTIDIDKEVTAIETRPDAKVIMVEPQDGELCVWMLLPDTAAPQAHRQFRIFGTGWEIPEGWEHRGSWRVPLCEWHLFEKVRP